MLVARAPGLRAALALCFAASGRAAAAPKTNVILFVIDDLGWADLAFKGLPPAMERVAGGHAEYTTPHLDTLARVALGVNKSFWLPQPCIFH
jgi:arylsulfatase A-like enzyme